MIDPNIIRKQPDYVKERLSTRGVEPEEIDHYLDLDTQNRTLITEMEALKRDKNQATEAMKKLAKDDPKWQANIDELKATNVKIKALEEEQKKVADELEYVAVRLPNIPDDSLPVGPDEDSDKEVRKWGAIPEFDFKPLDHWDVGGNLGILDFDRAAKVSGARFVYDVGDGARLERAIYNFMLDLHRKQGYTEIIPPYLVNANTMFGTGQFPKFKEDVYTVESTGMTLIPTAEVPLTNYYAQEILKEEDLPIYVTAMSPCFRSEAGSAGRDTRGLIRMHQFHKVEMVKFAKPEESMDELTKMTQNAEEVLRELGLPYHVIVLSTGDTGFSSRKTFDVEVWMPAQNKYREISSCSDCWDFQARRAMIRYRKADGTVDYVHTLNGSGLAVGRTLAAVLENYQQADGSVKIPDALVKYMGGQTVIKNIVK
ncbi:serine--tRNA ligase [Lacticaseibacillus baoqingensis]|uniref:Serine--tRNA ligase n=1 Tax=Lacticaseibacillus baoqingensis TaxID=2486013 RepID=A0ABW4E1G1_9LACO|nr:serine--tRNA ligase [Lacticaseibacillus baoqingensis]